jgi:hypothetical protein
MIQQGCDQLDKHRGCLSCSAVALTHLAAGKSDDEEVGAGPARLVLPVCLRWLNLVSGTHAITHPTEPPFVCRHSLEPPTAPKLFPRPITAFREERPGRSNANPPATGAAGASPESQPRWLCSLAAWSIVCQVSGRACSFPPIRVGGSESWSPAAQAFGTPDDTCPVEPVSQKVCEVS